MSGAGMVVAVLGLELDTCECSVRDSGGTRALAVAECADITAIGNY